MPQSPSQCLSRIVDWGATFFANVCRQGRRWWEIDRVTYGYVHDRLTYEDAITGMPTELPADRIAETVIPCQDPGNWTVDWEGRGTVSIVVLNENTANSGSNRFAPAPEPLDTATASFNFQHQGIGTQAILRISAIDTADPVRNLRVYHENDDADPDGWYWAHREQAEVFYRGSSPGARFLDWMRPNGKTEEGVQEISDIRPDTWWSESDTDMGVLVYTVGTWNTVPALGATVQIRQGSASGAVIGTGRVVRTSSHLQGRNLHVFPDPNINAGTVGDWIVSGASQAEIQTSNPEFYEGEHKGCSLKAIADYVSFFGLAEMALTLPYAVDETVHRHIARYFRDDPRLVGVKKVPERGNEQWNGFGSFSYGLEYDADQGAALGMPGITKGPPHLARYYQGAQYHAFEQNEINLIWVQEFGGRSSEIIRTFAIHNASGEEWMNFRTTMNPENEGATSPQYPQEVFVADRIMVAPYIGNFDSAPYNTAAWVLAASMGDLRDYLSSETAVYVTAPISGPPNYRSGGFESHRVYVAERPARQGGVPCELAGYEGGQHCEAFGATDPEKAAVNAKLADFNRSPEMGEVYAELAAEIAARAVRIYWYHSAGPFNGNYWGLVETPRTVLKEQVKFLAVTSTHGEVAQIGYAEDYTVGPPLRARVVEPVDPVGRLSSGSHRVTGSAVVARGAGGYGIITARLGSPSREVHHGYGLKAYATIVGARFAPGAYRQTGPAMRARLFVAVSVATLESGSYRMTGDALGRQAPAVGRLASGSIIESGKVGIHAERGVPAQTPRMLPRYWIQGAVAKLPKGPIQIPARTLLGWEMETGLVVPLRPGLIFAGIAIETAEPHREAVATSRRGSMRTEVGGSPPVDKPIIVYASNDVDLTYSAAASTEDELVRVGTGYVIADTGLVEMVYAAEAFDAGPPIDTEENTEGDIS